MKETNRKSYSKFDLLILFLIWFFSGYFMLFIANGGAAGSSEVSVFAWTCLAIYTILFIKIIRPK